MTVRAKLRLTQVTDYKWGKDAKPHRTLRFEAQYDDSIPEDQRFQQATPSGHAELQIDNPAALAQFEHGKAYYVDFTPADE